MKDGQGSIYIAMYPHLGLDIVAAMSIGQNLQYLALEADAVVVPHSALVLLASSESPVAIPSVSCSLTS
jgi:hypothetical protein